jgi:predicted flap endonuclease-1-like 5' DNA nuclease
MANKKIEEIEGIGPVNGEKLRAAGIADTDSLLERCRTKSGRKAIAEQTGISATSVLKWTNMADLFRVKGVAGEYAELLECAGVDTVKELATRNAENLAVKLVEVNDDKKLTRRVPNDAVVKDWVEQAKFLPPKIEY